MAVNLYQILKIRDDSSESTIKAAIERAESLGKIDPQMINAARQVLLNPDTRQKYDERLHREDNKPTASVHATAMSSDSAQLAYREPQEAQWITKFGIILAMVTLVIGYLIGHTHAMYQAAKTIEKNKKILTVESAGKVTSPVKIGDGNGESATLSPVQNKVEKSEDEKRDAENAQRDGDLDDKAKSDVSRIMKDPDSAQFKIEKRVYDKIEKRGNGTYVGNSNVVCGWVNSKNAYGGYVGFKRFIWFSYDGFIYLDGGKGAEDPYFPIIWNEHCN